MSDIPCRTSTRSIEVLLATYNGARFLQQQIDSVLAQSYPDVCITARDDSSTDGTADLLDRAITANPDRVRRLPTDGATGNAKSNFLRLMTASTAPYVALCDQDDVWLPQKLEQCMDAMLVLERQHGPSIPLLVFTDLTIVDRDLQVLHPSFWEHQHIQAGRIGMLPNLLAQNVVTGCTTLLNRALVERCLQMPSTVFMHDGWIALNACIFGKAAALHTPTVLYRQHDNNVVGAVQHARPKLIPSWRQHSQRRKYWERSERQAEALLEVHGTDLPPAQYATLQAYVRCERSPNRWARVVTWLRGRFFQKGLRPNLATLWYLWDMKAAKKLDSTAQQANKPEQRR